MVSDIPEIKKKINAFLVGEEGKISKESVLKAGAILGAVGVSSIALSGSTAAQTHSNSIAGSYSPYTILGTHTHHGSHSSHGSHGSHGSHSSGGWC